jgi:hypothetical protein
VTAELYTAVFTGFLSGKRPGEYIYLSVSEDPLGPQGDSMLRRGRPSHERLGAEIRFRDLPEGCRRLVLDTYRVLWDL